jgi:hypothetical protein
MRRSGERLNGGNDPERWSGEMITSGGQVGGHERKSEEEVRRKANKRGRRGGRKRN